MCSASRWTRRAGAMPLSRRLFTLFPFPFSVQFWRRVVLPGVLSPQECDAMKEHLYGGGDSWSGPCAILLDHPAVVAVLNEFLVERDLHDDFYVRVRVKSWSKAAYCFPRELSFDSDAILSWHRTSAARAPSIRSALRDSRPAARTSRTPSARRSAPTRCGTTPSAAASSPGSLASAGS